MNQTANRSYACLLTLATAIDKFDGLPEPFDKIVSLGEITPCQVSRPACREIADALGDPR
jgi:hypothetical protein